VSLTPTRVQPWIGPAVALGLAVLLVMSRRWGFPIPNPLLIFALVLVFSAYLGGLVSGLATTVIALSFTAYDWAIPGHPLTYAPEPLRRLVVATICMPAMAMLVGLLKSRADAQHQAIANYLALEKERNRELALALGRHAEPLEGALPICAWCHKTREEDGSWTSLEIVLAKKYGARITHGICPECRPAFLEGNTKESIG
jgi:MFS superfamily sulfate permease-like transporter